MQAANPVEGRFRLRIWQRYQPAKSELSKEILRVGHRATQADAGQNFQYPCYHCPDPDHVEQGDQRNGGPCDRCETYTDYVDALREAKFRPSREGRA